MYKLLLSLLIFPILALNAQPPLDKTLSFSETFQDSTLRIDYIFTGTHNSQEISLDEIHIGNGWAGRRVNLQELPLAGNGQIIMKDSESGNTIYKHSFSTLF